MKDDRPNELDITEQSFSFTTTQPAVLPKSKEKKTFYQPQQTFSHMLHKKNENITAFGQERKQNENA